MSKRQIQTTINGVQYRMNQLGAETCAELGEGAAESIALLGFRGVTGVAGTMKRVREVLRDVTTVLVVDEEDPRKQSRWIPLAQCYDDHFSGARAKDHGAWFAWACKHSGIPDFLAGAGGFLMPPGLLDRLLSVFLKGGSGSSTGSSSTSESRSAAAETSSASGPPATS